MALLFDGKRKEGKKGKKTKRERERERERESMHRIVHSFTDGNLGEPFASSAVVSHPEVAEIIRQTRSYAARRGLKSTNNTSAAAVKLQTLALEHATIIGESSCSAFVIRKLLKLKMRRNRQAQMGQNAHLANLLFDADGNFLGRNGQGSQSLDRGPSEDEGNEAKESMEPFEATQMAALMPQSTEETLAYLPTLARFELSELTEAVRIVIDDGMA
jgi:hypothetical protein